MEMLNSNGGTHEAVKRQMMICCEVDILSNIAIIISYEIQLDQKRSLEIISKNDCTKFLNLSIIFHKSLQTYR